MYAIRPINAFAVNSHEIQFMLGGCKSTCTIGDTAFFAATYLARVGGNEFVAASFACPFIRVCPHVCPYQLCYVVLRVMTTSTLFAGRLLLRNAPTAFQSAL